MSRIVDRAEVRRMLAAESAQLLEVLPRDEYEAEHIPGALSVPLKELDPDAAARLDRARPLIVYCNDFQ
jgi:rhodanese-related sulfurtransferase